MEATTKPTDMYCIVNVLAFYSSDFFSSADNEHDGEVDNTKAYLYSFGFGKYYQSAFLLPLGTADLHFDLQALLTSFFASPRFEILIHSAAALYFSARYRS